MSAYVFSALFHQPGGISCSPSLSDCPEEETQGALVPRGSFQRWAVGPAGQGVVDDLGVGPEDVDVNDGNVPPRYVLQVLLEEASEARR